MDSSRTRKRAWKGRSKNGCNRCKSKHLKCDELRPCTRCLRVGATCDLPLGMIAHPDRRPAEAETFHYYATQFAPNLPGLPDQEFWIRSVCPIGQNKDDVFDAVLAATTLYSLTQEQIFQLGMVPNMIRNKYQTAIAWYSRSLKGSVSQSEFSILLVASVIYVYTEIRLAHIENAETIARTTFLLVHSSLATLQGIADSVMLCALYMLLKLPVMLPIRSTAIPIEHRRSVVILALGINSKLGDNKRYLLYFELMNILWDLNDTIAGRLSMELDQRLQSYYQELMRTGENEPHMLYTVTQMQWQVYKYGLLKQRRMLEDRAMYMVEAVEWWIKYMDMKGKPALAWGLDLNVGPMCIMIIWFWRNLDIIQRFRVALADSAQVAYKNAILKYLEQLAGTPYDQPTALEQKLFRGQPRVLQFWHAFACTRELAK